MGIFGHISQKKLILRSCSCFEKKITPLLSNSAQITDRSPLRGHVVTDISRELR